MKLFRPLTIAATAALIAGCAHPPPPPAPYHAVGNEGWHLIVDDKHVTFIGAPGQTPILEPVPPATGAAGNQSYRTQRISATISRGACVAQGRNYPDRVQVYVDGRLRSGCGGL